MASVRKPQSRSSAPAGNTTPPAGMVRILVATNRPELPAGLADLLNPNLEIQCRAELCGDPHDLLAALICDRPDVLVLDLTIAGYMDKRLLGAIRARLPETRIILLWAEPSDLDVDGIIDYSIEGCQRLGDPAFLAGAVRTVLAGEIWMPRWLDQRIILRLREQLGSASFSIQFGSNFTHPRGSRLSMREREVTGLVRSGLSNKEIGRRLDISEDTVKKHLKRVFIKLGIHRRIQIALFDAPPQ